MRWSYTNTISNADLATLTVDKAAAHRFVKGALSGNPDQKKESDDNASAEDGEVSSADEATTKSKKRGGEKMSSSKKKRRGVDPFTGK